VIISLYLVFGGHWTKNDPDRRAISVGIDTLIANILVSLIAVIFCGWFLSPVCSSCALHTAAVLTLLMDVFQYFLIKHLCSGLYFDVFGLASVSVTHGHGSTRWRRHIFSVRL